MYPGYWSKIQAEKPAVINSLTGESISYQTMDQRSNQLAHLMFDHGLRRGDHIAVFLENDLRYFEITWAAIRSGLYVTPINRYLTAAEAAYIVNDCEAKVFISSSYLSTTAEHVIQHLVEPNLKLLMLDEPSKSFTSYHTAIANYPNTALAEEPLGNIMFYSSGSTGKPKGIVHKLTNRMVDNYPEMGLSNFKHLWHFDKNTIYLSTAPNYHAAPLHFSIQAQRLGGTVVMMPQFNGEAALKAIEQYKVTHSQWVPTMLNRLLKLPEPVRTKYDISTMTCALHGAAPCPIHIKEKIIHWFGPIVFEYYSASEGIGQTHITSEEWLKKPGSVGKAIFGTLHICDDNGRELSPDESGHVYFEMPFFSFQYKGDNKKTRSAQHPQHETWSTIGDIGFIDEEGYLFLNDRANFMIISGGVNIYPQEVENLLLTHPKVADAAVFGIPNDEMGEEVKAVVQLENQCDANDLLALELIDYSRSHLAHYKCPKSIDFTEKLPRLDTGKLYKKPLQEKYGKTNKA